MAKGKYKIDPEFRDYLPPAGVETDQQLRDLIIAEGEIRNPIHVWRGIVIDGNRRYKVAVAENVPFDVIDMSDKFQTREEVMDWMLADFLSRRSTSRHQTRIHCAKMMENHRNRNGLNRSQAAKKTAEELGISEDRALEYSRTDHALNALPREIKEALLRTDQNLPRRHLERLKKCQSDEQKAVVDYMTRNGCSMKKAMDEIVPRQSGFIGKNPVRRPRKPKANNEHLVARLDEVTQHLGKLRTLVESACEEDFVDSARLWRDRAWAPLEQLSVVVSEWKRVRTEDVV